VAHERHIEEILAAVRDSGGLAEDVRRLGPERAVMAGDLGAVPPSDLLNFLHQGRRDGVLLARTEGTERAIALLEGNVAWAWSTSPAERIGEVLCHLGLADRAQVHHLLRAQKKEAEHRRLGQMLVDAGKLKARDLARAVRHQTVEIFLGFLVTDRGAFAFLRGLDRSKLPSELGLDTEALLLDGLRRLDEMELFRSRVAGPQVRPRRTDKPVLEGLPEESQVVLGMCEGGLTLAQIAAGTALGEFETTKVVYRLVVAGYVAIEE